MLYKCLICYVMLCSVAIGVLGKQRSSKLVSGCRRAGNRNLDVVRGNGQDLKIAGWARYPHGC